MSVGTSSSLDDFWSSSVPDLASPGTNAVLGTTSGDNSLERDGGWIEPGWTSGLLLFFISSSSDLAVSVRDVFEGVSEVVAFSKVVDVSVESSLKSQNRYRLYTLSDLPMTIWFT